jgi:hypothetical protein
VASRSWLATNQAKEFALAHWLVNDADGGRLFVRCFGGDGLVRENAAGDVPASLTTMLWNAPSKSWTGGGTMAGASLNRRMAVRLGDAVAFAQIGVVGLDGQIDLEALRLHGMPDAAPALLCGTPALPVGQREFAAETRLDLPNLALGAAHLVDVTVPGTRQGGRAEASLASSMRLVEIGAFTWPNNRVRVLARNVSGSAFDLGAATLSVAVAVAKRRAPRACSSHTGRSSRPRTGSSTGLDKHFAEIHGSAAVVVRAGIPAERKRGSGMAQASSGDASSLRAAS